MYLQKMNYSTIRLIYLVPIVSIFITIVFLSAQLFFRGYVEDTHAAANTYTVCNAGCDFTSLYDALLSPGLDGDGLIDTITLTDTYSFDNIAETAGGQTLTMPSGILISCEASAETFGDQNEAEIELIGSTNITIEGCSFENTKISLFGTNVNLFDNTFASTNDSWITLTGVDGYEISGNVGIQRLQLQGADNGLIEDNDIECRFSGCVNVVTAGAPDYDNPPSIDANISNSVTIRNNRIINYATGNIGDWVLVNGGTDIEISYNTISSAVMLDNIYLTMVSIQNADAVFKNNYVIAPEKTAPADQATWAFNVRGDQYHVNVLYEHNTIYLPNEPDTCIGFYDSSNNDALNITIEAQYNLCYKDNLASSGNAISFSYDSNPGDAMVIFTDSYNGLYNFESPYVSDQNNNIVSLNPNTVTSHPLFKTEDADGLNDLELNPISRYFDIDGTRDIGAFGDPLGVDRVSVYLIDEHCVVDYSSCFSNTSDVLRNAISTGDSITVAEGEYNPITLDFPASNFELEGAGVTTIFNADNIGSAIVLSEITNATFSNFQVQESTAIIDTTYEITNMIFDFNGDTYNETAGIGFPSDDIMILLTDDACTVEGVTADGYDVTNYVDTATDDWNLALIDVFGVFKVTFIVPDRFISNVTEFETYALDKCGAAVTVDLFIPSIFTVNLGEYTYNQVAVDESGATMTPGFMDPAELNNLTTIEEAAGILLSNSDDNNFDGIIFDGNDIAFYVDINSEGNTILNSTFIHNVEHDIYSLATGINSLIDTNFDLAKIVHEGSGDIEVYHSVEFTIYRSANANPVNLAEVTIYDSNSNTIETLFTDVTGNTGYSLPILSYILNGVGPYTVLDGGFNPFTFTIAAAGYSTKNFSQNLITPLESFVVNMKNSSSSNNFPRNSSIFINHNAHITTTRNITLNLFSHNAHEMMIVNGTDFTDRQWQPYETEIPWILPLGDEFPEVCVMFLSSQGYSTTPLCDSIKLEIDEEDVQTERYDVLYLLNLSMTISTDKKLNEEENNFLCTPETLIKLSDDNNPLTQEDSAVYYCGVDGRRYVFPDEKTFFTWYSDFSTVQIISHEIMAQISLGNNVTVRPAMKMIKFTTDPKVYAVDRGGVLRWITTEEIAVELYGEAWNSFINDVSDAFFTNYSMGSAIE
jgi:hypothetical protein